MGKGSGAEGARTSSREATTSTSPVGSSGFSLPSGRRRTSPLTSTQNSLRRWCASSSRATTCTYPEASRRSRKTTPPWSRRRATQPARVTCRPASGARREPASCVRSKAVPFGKGLPAVVDVRADALVVEPLEVGQLGVGEGRQGGGGDVAAHLLDGAGAGDDRRDAGLVDHPAQRERRRGGLPGDRGHLAGGIDPDLEGDPGEGLTDVEGLAVPVEVPVVVGRERRRLVVLAGQQTAGQGNPGEDADPGTGGRRQQLLQRLAPEDVQDHLDGLHARVLQSGQPLGHGLDRDAVGGDRAVGDESVERVVDALVAVDGGRRAVQLDEVERVDAEVAAGPVDPRAQVLGGVLRRLERVGAAPGLGGDERPLTPGGQRLADPLLRAPVAVHVRDVEEGHAGVERGSQDVGRRVVVDVPPVTAELPRAQPDDAHLCPGPPERPLFHRRTHSPTVARTTSNSSLTGTGRCSPVRRSLSWPTPSARSRSPMTTTCEAPARSAAFIAPLSPRLPYTVSAAIPARRSSPTRRTASRLASSPSGTTKAWTPGCAPMSSPSAWTASRVRSTPMAYPIPETSGPPRAADSPS